MESKFPEQAWCRFRNSEGDMVYVRVCYRTPSVDIFGSDGHDSLRSQVNEIGQSKKHFILMRDFNYRLGTWPPQYGALSGDEQNCYDCVEYNYLT